MKRRGKVVAILPAFNAEKTVASVLQSLPKGVFDDIIVSDDCSVDKTWNRIAKMRHITCIRTPRNLGYGGNVKYCLSKALSVGADIIVEIHPDGEYEVDGIVPAIHEVENGAQLVLGNRYSRRIIGMYWWKYFGTKALSYIDNILLGRVLFIKVFPWGPAAGVPPRPPTKGTPAGGGPPARVTHAPTQNYPIPDLHQGFRVYTRELLETVNYRAGGNDYIFSFQIIVAAIARGMKVASVPVSTRYTGSKRGARTNATFQYSWDTFHEIIRFWLFKLGYQDVLYTKKFDRVLPACPICRNGFLVYRRIHQKQYSVYFCQGCNNGFTYPVPHSMSPWYRQEYYLSFHVVEYLKKTVYQYFQKRRTLWVKQYLRRGLVVDVGSGEGYFGKILGNTYSVVNIEAPFALVRNDKVIKTNFLSWRPKKPADAVVFWESLEHVSDPRAYLSHAASVVRPGGYICIEYPRFNSLESRALGSRWYHLDLPRHLTHLSEAGISSLTGSCLRVVEKKGIWAPEYAVLGFAASVFGLTANDLTIRLKSPLFYLLFVPILAISFVIETILMILDQSPIGLLVVRKKDS